MTFLVSTRPRCIYFLSTDESNFSNDFYEKTTNTRLAQNPHLSSADPIEFGIGAGPIEITQILNRGTRESFVHTSAYNHLSTYVSCMSGSFHSPF
jgi:hypothetical protein